MLVCSRALEWLENTRSSIVSAREREAHAMLAFVCWQFVGAESFEPCPNALSREQKLRTSCRNALLQTRAVGRGVQPPLDFKIWHFPIKFLATKGHFLSFERVKWNFKENPLFPPPRKISFRRPWLRRRSEASISPRTSHFKGADSQFAELAAAMAKPTSTTLRLRWSPDVCFAQYRKLHEAFLRTSQAVLFRSGGPLPRMTWYSYVFKKSRRISWDFFLYVNFCKLTFFAYFVIVFTTVFPTTFFFLFAVGP